MKQESTTLQKRITERQMFWALPNLLTYGRIAAVGLIALIYVLSSDFSENTIARLACAAIFILASATDYLDGYYARKMNLGSAIGKMLDPIADKILVAVVLLILCADHTITGWNIMAPILIFGREFLVSGIREIVGANSGIASVTQLAKWKTTVQLICLAILLAGPNLFPIATLFGLILLWLATALTIITGYDYFTKGVAHIIKSED